jgi:hypothetical protein
VRAAIVALGGDPAATLRDLVTEQSDTTVAVDTVGTTLEAVRVLVDGLLNIPEAELPASGQLRYPEFIADLLPLISSRLNAVKLATERAQVLLYGPDLSTGGLETGITSITTRLDALIAAGPGAIDLTELIDATVFNGTRLTDIYNRLGTQHAESLAKLTVIANEITRLAQCTCGDPVPVSPEVPVCMDAAPLRVSGWSDGGAFTLAGAPGTLYYPNWSGVGADFGLVNQGGGTEGRFLIKAIGSGFNTVQWGLTFPTAIAGSAVLVTVLTATGDANTVLSTPFTSGIFDTFEAFPGGICNTFVTFDIGLSSVAAGDVVGELVLFIPDGGPAPYTDLSMFIVQGSGAS